MADEIFVAGGREALEEALPSYLLGRRWFSAKARKIDKVKLAGAVPLAESSEEQPRAYFSFIEVVYAEGDSQFFVLPLAFAGADEADALAGNMAPAVVARVPEGVLYDATWDAGFAGALLQAVGQDRSYSDGGMQVTASSTPLFDQIVAASSGPLTPRVVGAEQSNTSIIYGHQLILKLFRRLEEGTSPDLEVGRFLTEQGYRNTPPMAGSIERVGGDGEPRTLAIVQGFVQNKGDAWSYTLAELESYFDRVTGRSEAPEAPAEGHLLDQAAQELPAAMEDALGDYLGSARLLARRTAEMHLALGAASDDPAFGQDPFTLEYQHELLASVEELVDRAFRLLQGRLEALPAATRAKGESAISMRSEILARFDPLRERVIHAMRTRCHGDYHLGQILWTGSDFMIIDFEGEPIRNLAERRRKHSPLKDVAGMLRSFHYGAYAALFSRPASDDDASLKAWADAWHQWISAAYLREYLAVAGAGTFLPPAREDLQLLLDAYLAEKAIYELIYELNNRPDWVAIPLQGVSELVR